MREINSIGVRLAYLVIGIGFIAGVASFVRLGSIAIAHWKTGKVERYLALGIALALLAVAISLPRGL
jgi:hypothetical protein